MITAAQFRTRKNEVALEAAEQEEMDKQHYIRMVDMLLENSYNHFSESNSDDPLTFSVPARRVGDRMSDAVLAALKAHVEAAGFGATVTSKFNAEAQRCYLHFTLTF
jgi:hypothetical protein